MARCGAFDRERRIDDGAMVLTPTGPRDGGEAAKNVVVREDTDRVR